ncbi:MULTISPECIES: fluoride efflux transporter CrcB [unclassified Streptomyces]|uniref:fluoride efflux transporter CrcB n=1 Tax=unclassified Streptomyces TaxID=2593676 RepID=UPI002DD9F714|nr:fluoride efflux transporter CrcB [Streptomyces sp. NBC_01750]WSA99348.1 fluoride efflux transporter CrcB [Streptomyces sp. NBC_01794]WSD36086.1 fluoride efflux transporter CrcB [Streptomyces sp. NBC_01750]
MIILLAVGAAAAAGAVARYVLGQYVQYRSPGAFPRGTWLINVSGSFVLGLLVGLGARHALPEQVVTIAGVGFCGAYTTFSTFSYELVLLCEKGQVGKALLYAASSLAVGLAAAAAALAIGSF